MNVVGSHLPTATCLDNVVYRVPETIPKVSQITDKPMAAVFVPATDGRSQCPSNHMCSRA